MIPINIPTGRFFNGSTLGFFYIYFFFSSVSCARGVHLCDEISTALRKPTVIFASLPHFFLHNSNFRRQIELQNYKGKSEEKKQQMYRLSGVETNLKSN